MIPQTDEYIEELLKGLWGELEYEGCDKEVADSIISHYKGVIKEMLLEYGREVVDECAEQASPNYVDDDVWEGKSHQSGIDKQSILNVKNMIN